MDLSTTILGTSTAKQIQERQRAVLLTIGSDTFDRAALASVACFNFSAAANLSKILNRDLRVKDTRAVFATIAPSALALPGLGAVSLAVLGAAFEAKGLGGDAPLENWVRKHQPEDATLVTFDTLKHRDAQARAAETTARKRRRAARRDTAHRHRVRRYTTRAAGATTVP